MNLEESAALARSTSRYLQSLNAEKRKAILHGIARELEAKTNEILSANQLDMEAAQKAKMSDVLLARLKLDQVKLQSVISGIRSIAHAEKPDPLGKILRRTLVADQLELRQITVPIGCVLVIFESRPDALPQIVALSLISGNGLLLKGGSEAARSNEMLFKIINDTVISYDSALKGIVSLISTRHEVADLLRLDHLINLVIPRGSNQLVRYIQKNTKIPVLGHADGICHIYIDQNSDLEKAIRIVIDSKTDYPAACNAVETLLIHRSLLMDGRASKLIHALQQAKVKIHGSKEISDMFHCSVASSFAVEYSSLDISVAVVDNMEAAIKHIHQYGSGHTEAIITEDLAMAHAFLQNVDSACVFHNASTRFADGYRFGLGAEVGISTSKIHARGPVGVEGLLTTKWTLVSTASNGHIVSDFAKSLKYKHESLPLIRSAL